MCVCAQLLKKIIRFITGAAPLCKTIAEEDRDLFQGFFLKSRGTQNDVSFHEFVEYIVICYEAIVEEDRDLFQCFFLV